MREALPRATPVRAHAEQPSGDGGTSACAGVRVRALLVRLGDDEGRQAERTAGATISALGGMLQLLLQLLARRFTEVTRFKLVPQWFHGRFIERTQLGPVLLLLLAL